MTITLSAEYLPENHHTTIAIGDEKLITFLVPRDLVHLKVVSMVTNTLFWLIFSNLVLKLFFRFDL